jgi:hypothetical protein
MSTEEKRYRVTAQLVSIHQIVVQGRDEDGDLYDPLLMPSPLLKLHKKLDSTVLKAFGLKAEATDSELLGFLFSEYARLSDDKLL